MPTSRLRRVRGYLQPQSPHPSAFVELSGQPSPARGEGTNTTTSPVSRSTGRLIARHRNVIARRPQVDEAIQSPRDALDCFPPRFRGGRNDDKPRPSRRCMLCEARGQPKTAIVNIWAITAIVIGHTMMNSSKSRMVTPHATNDGIQPRTRYRSES